MPGYHNLTLWAGNNAPEIVFRFPFDLDRLRAVPPLRRPLPLRPPE